MMSRAASASRLRHQVSSGAVDQARAIGSRQVASPTAMAAVRKSSGSGPGAASNASRRS
jgi:hypothetical protein